MRPTLAFVFAGIVASSVLLTSQTPAPIAHYTATTANVSGAGDAVRFEVLKWSTDAERDQLLNVWTHPNTPAPAPAAAAAPTGAAGGGGAARGGAGGGRGGGAAAGAGGAGRGAGAAGGAPPLPPAAGDAPAAVAAPAAAGGARGGGGRGGGGGGGGRGGGGAAADVQAETPEGALLTAVQKASSVGILWTSESAGYSLRFAYRMMLPDGGERIILVTDRRLGTFSDQWWKPTGTAAPTNYGFTLIELRINDKGDGEGRTSLTGKVAEDTAAKSIALDNYSAQPVMFKGVKKAR